MSKYKLVCFDLDDTITREIDSVTYLCVLAGKIEESNEITTRESAGEIYWIDADYMRAELFAGLSALDLKDKLTDYLKPLKNIDVVVKSLHEKGIKCIVVTAGPKQVSEAAAQLWGFDGYYGTDYEVENGVFTGKITQHIGERGKIACLDHYCAEHGIKPEECVAVGDGLTDLPLFEYSGMSIAINYAPVAVGKATHYIRTDDLSDILQFIG